MRKNKTESISQKVLNIIIMMSPLMWFTLVTVNYIGIRIHFGVNVMLDTSIVSTAFVSVFIIVAYFNILYVKTKIKNRNDIFIISMPFFLLLAQSFCLLFFKFFWEISIPVCKAVCFVSASIAMCRIAQRLLIRNDRKVVYWVSAVLMCLMNTTLAIFSNALWTDLRYNLPQFNLDYSYFVWNELHYRIGIIAAVRYPALFVISHLAFGIGYIQYKISKRRKYLIMIIDLKELGEVY